MPPRFAAALFLLSTAALSSCGDSAAPNGTAALAVAVSTTGADLDPDGYSLTITGPAPSERAVGINETVRLTVPPGSYSLTLAGLRFNCAVDGTNPRQATFADGAGNAPVEFAVQCTQRTVASVAITPRPTSLGVNELTRLVATPLDAADAPIDGVAVSWASSSDALATVSAEGIVLGRALGSVTITATAGGLSTGLPLEIAAPAASISVSPAAVTLDGATCSVKLAAVFRDAQGVEIPGRVPVWIPIDPDLAQVTVDGTVTPVAPGTTTILAFTRVANASAAVTVTEDALRCPQAPKAGSISGVSSRIAELPARPAEALSSLASGPS